MPALPGPSSSRLPACADRRCGTAVSTLTAAGTALATAAAAVLCACSLPLPAGDGTAPGSGPRSAGGGGSSSGGGAAAAVAAAPPVLSPGRIAAIVAAPDRSDADRANDLRRKPAQLLEFIGLRPGMTVLDLSAGGGYTTELLARAVGPSGRVYGQSPPRGAVSPRPPAAPEGGMVAAPVAVSVASAASAAFAWAASASASALTSAPTSSSASAAATTPAPAVAATPPTASSPPRRSSPEALAERARNPAAGNIVAVVRPFEDPVPPEVARGGLDLVTLMFNYHDLGHLGVDRERMNRAVFAALRPGGSYVIADHAGRPGTGISESGTLHRIEEAFLRREVEQAGFVLAAEAGFLRNPADPRDRNTPEPPQPKDEFVLKFVRP